MHIYFSLIILLFISHGCKDSTEAQHSEEKPFTVTYQKDTHAKTVVISSRCKDNDTPKYIYFPTQNSAENNIFNTIRNLYTNPTNSNLKPFWDIRYTNPVNKYIDNSSANHFPNHSKLTGLDARGGTQNITIGTNFSQVNAGGSIVQSKCVNGSLTAGMTANLFDAPEQVLTYSGIASTFVYILHTNVIYPWETTQTGNLVLQAYFDEPIYNNYDKNIGGSISFNIFIHNSTLKKSINFVIGIYAIDKAWKKEKIHMRYDVTTDTIHVATVISKDSWWSTISPHSNSIKEIFNSPNKHTSDDGQWNDFYRVNISYQNLLAVLKELKTNPPTEIAGQDFGLSPEDWTITLLGVQYELEEEGGKASLSGSFKDFEVYLSKLPL